jgi:hypothetical protein
VIHTHFVVKFCNSTFLRILSTECFQDCSKTFWKPPVAHMHKLDSIYEKHRHVQNCKRWYSTFYLLKEECLTCRQSSGRQSWSYRVDWSKRSSNLVESKTNQSSSSSPQAAYGTSNVLILLLFFPNTFILFSTQIESFLCSRDKWYNSGSQTLLNSSHSALNSFSSKVKNIGVIIGVMIDGIQYRPILRVSHLSFALC